MKKVMGFAIVTAQVILGVIGLLLGLAAFTAAFTLAFHLLVNILVAAQDMMTSPVQRAEALKTAAVAAVLLGCSISIRKLIGMISED